MKKLVKAGAFLAAIALVLVGCNCYNKMSSRMNEIKITSTPEVLALRGSTVTADMTVTFPAKYFNKKAVLKLTPVLVFDGGEIAGEPKFVQGEKVKDNYTVIPFKAGGSYRQTVVLPFDERASISTLELRIEYKCGCDDKEFELLGFKPVADGVSTIQNSADWASNLAIMPDNFKRVTTITQEADLVYLVNSSQVRPVALNSAQIKLLEEFVKENSDKDRTELGNLYSKGYASPEGPVAFNDQLSKSRSESAKNAVGKKLKKTPVNIDAAAYGEDWEGFEKLVEQSNIQDRDLILQVLRMYSSPVQRDQEIRNMSQVFDVLKKEILPQLRRTQLVANADITGKTDEEIKYAWNNNIGALNVEELLYSATLFSDNATKAKIYKAAADRFNDVRGFNNYGVVMVQEGKLADATTAFNKAASMSSAPEISNNMGVIALIQGNVEDARRYLSPLNSDEAKANKGLLALAEGDFATASKSLTGYNLAVAQLSDGNVSQAKASLGNIDTADADYLRAVIAMREGNTESAISNLNSAVKKDPSLAERAKRDIEFARIFGHRDFLAL